MSDEKTGRKRALCRVTMTESRAPAADAPAGAELQRIRDAIKAGVYEPDLEELANRMLWDVPCIDDLLPR